MDLKRMLKVYNYVNDEQRPKVNLKFMGLMAGFLVVGGLLISFAIVSPEPPGTAGGGAAGSASTQDDARTEHVGLTPAEVDLYGIDQQLIRLRLDAWNAQHPQADIISLEKDFDAQGRWTGYLVTYVD